MASFSRFAERALHSRLRTLRRGALTLQDGADTSTWGEPAAAPAVIVVHDRRFYSAVALRGSAGAGDAYAHGWWSSPDLTAVIRLMAANRDVLEGIENGWARLTQPLQRLIHTLNDNTRRGARRNIAAHYDLSNDFFASFLDETLTYSCGHFDRPEATLRDASIAKYDRIAALLDLRSTDRVVEVGCGWGGFAMHAAATYGCHVTATTISAEQYALAAQRIRERGLENRITLLREDYRDLRGRFDKLVSIEMVEAVGHEHFGEYFSTLRGLLHENGRAAIQAITIEPHRYDSARRHVDFLKQYIFPGSCIPSLPVLERHASAAGLRTLREDDMGFHYAETLRRWRANLVAAGDRVRALGFDDYTLRLWDFYFAYCEGGFMERSIGVSQLLYAPAAADWSVPLGVPAIREVRAERAA